MNRWVIETTDQYERDFKYFEKKLPNELRAMIDNLDTYFKILNECGNPLQVMTGFIHHEPEGIKGIDQKGGGQKAKLQQARLYIYPNVSNNTLYLLKIGTKTNQRADITSSREQVRRIKARGLK